jgi:hypothetical protein
VTPHRLCCFTLALLLAGVAQGAGKSEKPVIDGLTAQLEQDRVLVSFRVANGLSDEALEKIHSGIPVTFRHRVELLSRRSFPLPSKVLSRAVIETRAEYDSLTQRYSLFRTFIFRGRQKNPDAEPERESLVTQATEDVRAWMTEFADLSLAAPVTPKGRLKVQVESALGRRYILLIFPGRLSASAEYRLGS